MRPPESMKPPERVFDVWRDGHPLVRAYSKADLDAIPLKPGDLVFGYLINSAQRVNSFTLEEMDW